jgi:hypothetical protein
MAPNMLEKRSMGGTQKNIHIINVQWPDIGQLFDLGRAFLALSISQVQAQLLNSALDGIPAGQPGCEMDISGDSEIGRIDDFVGAWVRQDGLGMNTSLMGEGTETSNVVVEGDVDFNGLGNEVLEISELWG